MDIEYFKHHILPLKNKLFRKALSITESASEAEDVVQEIMMCLWDRKDKWPNIDNIEVYSMVLVKNLALDRIKKKSYKSKTIDINEAEQTGSESHQEKLENAEQTALVWKIIHLLPEQCQELIRLREIEELSYREIAKAMNITEAQVKVTLFRARQKIKEIYLKINNHHGY